MLSLVHNSFGHGLGVFFVTALFFFVSGLGALLLHHHHHHHHHRGLLIMAFLGPGFIKAGLLLRFRMGGEIEDP